MTTVGGKCFVLEMGCSILMRKLIAVYSAMLLFIATDYASARSEFFKRSEDISIRFEIEDRKLGNYIKSYFNIITTFHESNVSAGGLANLIILESEGLVANGVLDGEKVRSFGLSDEVVTELQSSDTWASGCGTYLYVNNSGYIASSITIIDGSTPFHVKVNCSVVGVGKSFGLSLSTTPESTQYYLMYALIYALASRACGTDPLYRSCVESELSGFISDFSAVFGMQ
ncbi:hypothetical protein [Roseibium sp.]|uniref:hypothetical protein n=1 Tax=Roseibium sp. TaxID=1936156 RepID=UPI003A976F3F